MLEWKKLARSIRLTVNGVECDVWSFLSTNGDRFNFTVMDGATCVYLESGSALTQDEACEAAMKAATL